MNAQENLVQYDEFSGKLKEVKNACNFIPDISTDEGYQKSKRVSLDVGKILTSLEKCRKGLKSDALEYGRKVDSEAKLIVAQLEQWQKPHKEAYKNLDNAKKEREAKRKAVIEQRVEEIRTLPDAMRDSDSSGVKMAMESLQVEACLGFYEYTEQTLKTRNASRAALAEMLGAKLKQEEEARELARLRKQEEERNLRERDERIARESAEKIQREASGAVERAEKEQQRLKDEAEAAERRATEAENMARQKLADEKAEFELAEARRKANREHRGNINRLAVAAMITHGVSKDEAKGLVAAIYKNQIPNITIHY